MEWPVTKKSEFTRFKLVPPRGILLYGPPGCAKTTLAKVCAFSSNCAFIALSPADVYNSPYLGDAEAVIRKAFRTARIGKPCVLFFDEIDAVVGSESYNGGDDGAAGMGGRGDGKGVEARVLATFLNEMDGANVRGDDGVMVLAATNRPNVLDAALLRQGRFDKIVYVGPPDFEGRKQVFRIHLNEIEIDNHELDNLATLTESFTGAEIEGVCREVLMSLLMEELDSQENEKEEQRRFDGVANRHRGVAERLVEAVSGVKPLLSKKKSEIAEDYEIFRRKQQGSLGMQV